MIVLLWKHFYNTVFENVGTSMCLLLILLLLFLNIYFQKLKLFKYGMSLRPLEVESEGTSLNKYKWKHHKWAVKTSWRIKGRKKTTWQLFILFALKAGMFGYTGETRLFTTVWKSFGQTKPLMFNIKKTKKGPEMVGRSVEGNVTDQEWVLEICDICICNKISPSF